MTQSIIGILIKLAAVVFVVLIATFMKMLPSEIPISQIMFFRSFLAIPFVLIYVIYLSHGWNDNAKKLIKPNNIWLHIRRSFFGMTAMALTFTAVRTLPLPLANALKELAPIFITILAVIFLQEKIRIYRSIGLILGICGVGIISYQAIGGSSHLADYPYAITGVIAALTSALCIAFAQIQIRSMVKTESPQAVVLFFFIFTSLVTLCFLPFGWVWPEGNTWLILFAIGASGGAAQLCITTAYKFADASTLAPFEYFSIPIALIIGGVFFSEWPSAASFLGMVLILAGGLIIIFRENQLRKTS